jgi:ubiquinone/menaquinone biosynthesis C-methylase UbiE
LTGIDFQRLYEYRFRDVDQTRRESVWAEVARYLHRRMGAPSRVLDPAAGRGEFIEAVPATERWAVDAVAHLGRTDSNVKTIVGDIREVSLPDDYFDGVFVSNFLEHLPTPDAIGEVLAKLATTMKTGARLAVLGPNFRYCWREYFDCADHVLPLTHVSAAEHAYAAGFEVSSVVPRFLPFSFRGALPASPRLTRTYLRAPALWPVLGKQFLVLARKPD